MSKRNSVHDISRPGRTGLPLGDPLPASKADFVPPTAVTDPPSKNSPNATFPERMNPRSPGAASQPVVPEGAAMKAAADTAPAAPPPKTGEKLPSKVSAAEVKQESLRHAQGNAMRGEAMSLDSIKAQSFRYGGSKR